MKTKKKSAPGKGAGESAKKTKPAESSKPTKPAASKKPAGSSKSAKLAASKKPAGSKTPEKQLFKFYRYKKAEGSKQKSAKHPKLIVEKQETTVGFMGLTESPKRGHHNNIELTKNPQKGNPRKAYIRKELRYTNSDNFGDILNDYKLSEKDKQKVIEYINKLKKKK